MIVSMLTRICHNCKTRDFPLMIQFNRPLFSAFPIAEIRPGE